MIFRARKITSLTISPPSHIPGEESQPASKERNERNHAARLVVPPRAPLPFRNFLLNDARHAVPFHHGYGVNAQAVFVQASRPYLVAVNGVALDVLAHEHAVTQSYAVPDILRPHAVPVMPFGNGDILGLAARQQGDDEHNAKPQ